LPPFSIPGYLSFSGPRTQPFREIPLIWWYVIRFKNAGRTPSVKTIILYFWHSTQILWHPFTLKKKKGD
jgi:hypothetical protein